MSLKQDFPDINSFKAYMVNDIGSVEVIPWSLYDTMLYPTAGVAALNFFQTQQGQGLSAQPGFANNPKSQADTNMELSGQLASPQGFWVDSVEVYVEPGSVNTANTFALQIPSASPAAAAATAQAGEHDVYAIYTTGALVFTIGQKPYLKEAPLMRLPPRRGKGMDVALANNSATAVLSIKALAQATWRPYYTTPGLPIMTSQNFGVALQWPVAVATPSGFNAQVRVALQGWLFRAVQ
jgi:hypothetical protein